MKNWMQRFLRNGVCALWLTIAMACEAPKDHADNDAMNTKVALTDYWISDAIDLMNKHEQRKAERILMAQSLPPSDQVVVVEMFKNAFKEIYKATLNESNNQLHTYYFDDGLLAYSTLVVQTPAEPQKWLVAYAQQMPYNAALMLADGRFLPVPLKATPLKTIYIKEIVNLVKKHELLEQSPSWLRINTSDTLLLGEISENQQFHYSLNAIKGERIKVSLTAEEPHLFFTLKPVTGADMEHRDYEFLAAHTGDIVITVFSLRGADKQPFKLHITKGQHLKGIDP
jgi:hypothetical protein